MPKKANFLLCLLFVPVLAFSLVACFDAREIDDEVYAISIGIDYGIHNKIRLTIQFPTYAEEAGGNDKETDGSNNKNNVQGRNLVHTIEGPTVLEAVDLFGMSISRRISLMHAKFLFFSEEVARDGIAPYIQAFNRFSETRPSMVVVVVNGKAEDFILQNTTKIGGTISKAMELLFSQAEEVGYFPRAILHDFAPARAGYQQPVAIYGGINKFNKLDEKNEEATEYKENEGKPLVNHGHKPGNLPRKGETSRELVGTAVFKGDKMVGSLDEYETIHYLLAVNKLKAVTYSIIDSKYEKSAITFKIRSNGVKVRIDLSDREKPKINVNINIEADIESIQSEFNYENLKHIEELNKLLGQELLKGINKVLEKVQTEFQADIFGFGKWAAGKFLTIKEWEEYNWNEKFPNADIQTKVVVNIRRTGSLIQSSDQ